MADRIIVSDDPGTVVDEPLAELRTLIGGLLDHEVEASTATGSKSESLLATIEARVTLIEHALRRELWINHGHPWHALYGDDGELACNACMLDFKRAPLDVVQQRALTVRASTAHERPHQFVRLPGGAPDECLLLACKRKPTEHGTWGR